MLHQENSLDAPTAFLPELEESGSISEHFGVFCLLNNTSLSSGKKNKNAAELSSPSKYLNSLNFWENPWWDRGDIPILHLSLPQKNHILHQIRLCS